MAGRTPEETDRLIGEALGRRDLDAVLELFEPDGVLVDPGSGRQLHGQEEIRAGVAAMFGGGVESLESTPPTVLVTGDIALVLSGWTIEVLGANGQCERVTGTATDVLRRGVDGEWRYVIDNPAGVEVTH